MSNFFTARRGNSHRSYDSGSYSDDDSNSYDSHSYYSDDDSRNVPHLADLIPLPGIRTTAEDLDRIIDDYLDGGLAKYIDKGAINKFFTGSSQSMASLMDDDTDFTSAFSPQGSTIHIKRSEADDALTKMSTVTPSYYDDSTRSKCSQPSAAAASSLLPHRTLSTNNSGGTKNQTSNSKLRGPKKLTAEDKSKGSAATLAIVDRKATKSKTKAPSTTQRLRPKVPLPDWRSNRSDFAAIKQSVTDADDILEDLQSTKDVRHQGSSIKPETGSINSILAHDQDEEEEIVFGDEKEEESLVKPDRLWGGLSLWEKLPIKTEEEALKARSSGNRVTFAENPEIREGDLWENTLEPHRQAEIVDIITNLSAGNASPWQSDRMANDRPSIILGSQSRSGSETGVSLIRTPASPAALEAVPAPPPIRATSTKLYAAPHATDKSSTTKNMRRSPLFPKNRNPTRVALRGDNNESYLPKGPRTNRLEETSVQAKHPVPMLYRAESKARGARMEEVILTPPHAPFVQEVCQEQFNQPHHPPAKKPYSSVSASQSDAPESKKAASIKAGKPSLRQRAQSRLHLRVQPVQPQSYNIAAPTNLPISKPNVLQIPVYGTGTILGETIQLPRCGHVPEGSEVEVCLEAEDHVTYDVQREHPHFSELTEPAFDTQCFGESYLAREKSRKKLISDESKQEDRIAAHMPSSTVRNIDVSSLQDTSNGVTGTSPGGGDEPPSTDDNIEAVLSIVNLFDSEGNKVNEEGMVKKRSFGSSMSGLASPFARQSRHPNTPIKIGAGADSIELEGKFPEYIWERETNIPPPDESILVSAPVDSSDCQQIPTKSSLVPPLAKAGCSILKRIRSLPIAQAEKKMMMKMPGKSKEDCASAAPTDAAQNSMHDMVRNGAALFDGDSVLASPIETQAMNGKDSDGGYESFQKPENHPANSNHALIKQSPFACNPLNDRCSLTGDYDDSTLQTLSKAVRGDVNPCGAILPKENFMVEGADSTEVERQAIDLEVATSIIAEPESVPGFVEKLAGLRPIPLLGRVRSNKQHIPEKIVNELDGVEVSIAKERENILKNAGRLLILGTRRKATQVPSKQPGPPSFEEAYMHLKAKLIDGSPSFKPANHRKGDNTTAMNEHKFIAVASNPEKSGVILPDSIAFMVPPTPSKLVDKSSRHCRTIFDGPLLGGELCGADTPDSLRSQQFTLATALKACRGPELSPSASYIPDENSLLDDENLNTAVAVVGDSSVPKTPKPGIRLREKIGSLRHLTGWRKNARDDVQPTGTPRRAIPMMLPRMRRNVTSQTSAGTKGSVTVEVRNPPCAIDERDLPDTPGSTDGNIRGRRHAGMRSRSRSRSQSRRRELSMEKKKKLRFFEHTVERRLEADKALLQAIQAKMTYSPHHSKRRRRQKSMLELLESHFDPTASCGRSDKATSAQGLAGSIGDMLACTNPRLALKEVESP